MFSLSESTVEAATDHALMLLPHLRLLHQQRLAVAARTERLLDELSITQESQPPSDVQVLLSLPGVGRIVTATLLAEASYLIAERDYHALRAHAGEVRAGLVDCWLEVREKGADLAGDSFGLDGGLDGSAIGVAEDENDLGSEDGGAVFEAADDFRRYDVVGDAGDEDVSDGLGRR
jgi:hypothetical protein